MSGQSSVKVKSYEKPQSPLRTTNMQSTSQVDLGDDKVSRLCLIGCMALALSASHLSETYRAKTGYFMLYNLLSLSS